MDEDHPREGEANPASATALRDRIAGLMGQVQPELAELVAIPSVADPRQFPPQECARAAQWVRDAFAGAGFADARLAETADGSQAVLGTRRCPDPHAPTVLLYAHYDVQPPLNEADWRTPPFELTEVDGRWYGRGAADCKGNILMHLTALRALGDAVPVNLKLVIEGSEETTGALEDFVPPHADLLRADAILVCDAGNAAVGQPAITVSLRGVVDVIVHVAALKSELHSGLFGGAAPDALAALVAMLATLRDASGNTTVRGLDNTQVWPGAAYSPETFRADAGVLDGVALLGDGTVADMIWSRPAVTIVGIDCPPVVGSAPAIVPRASARLNLRVPPGTKAAGAAEALVSRVPGHRGGHAGGLWPADGDAGRWRLDPAVQRVRRHLPRCGAHLDGRRGTAGTHPRSQRERRSCRDRGDGPHRSALFPALRRHHPPLIRKPSRLLAPGGQLA